MAFKAARDAEKLIRLAVVDATFRIAEDIKNRASAKAPKGGEGGRNAAYANQYSYKVQRVTDSDGPYLIVGSTDPNAHIIEFGSEDSPEYAPLRTAIREAGFELKDLGESRGASGDKRGTGRTKGERKRRT